METSARVADAHVEPLTSDGDDEADANQPSLKQLAREALLVGALAVLGALWVMQAWGLHPTVPVALNGDALFHLAAVENLRDGGWYLHNDRLAAPLGQDVRDFPMGGENLHWLALKVLTFVTPTVGATVNLYLLLSYPAVAVVTFIVARRLGLDRGPATVVALLYAFLPYHQGRWTGHLLRVAYYAIPIGVLVVFRILNWQGLRERNSAGGWRWSRRRTLPLLLVALLMGGFDTQHALYGALILFVVSIGVALRDRDVRPVGFALVFGVLAATSLALNNTPALIARVERGSNPAGVDRGAYESELYGLRPAALVLPNSSHRFGPLAELGERFNEAVLPGAGEVKDQTLGIVGAAGLLLGLAALCATAAGRRIAPRAPIDLTACGLIIGTAILIGSVGSVPAIFATFGITEYRTWGRISVWIAFPALLVVGSLLQYWARRSIPRPVVAAVFAGIVLIGVADEVSPVSDRFDPGLQAEIWNRDDLFYSQVEGALPEGAMVHQMPMTRFPEAGTIQSMSDYEHLDGYIHTDHLRWSYGGMRGRPEGEWLRALATFSTEQQLAIVAGLGFDSVLVDRRGFADYGAAVEGALAQQGATVIAEHESGDRVAYDLRPLREAVGAAGVEPRDVLDGLQVWSDFDPVHFGAEEGTGTGTTWRWSSSSDSVMTLHSERPERVEISAQVDHADPNATEVIVEALGEQVVVPTSGDEATAFSLWLDLPAGDTTIRLRSDGAPVSIGGRQVAILLRDVRLVTDDVASLLCDTKLPGVVCPSSGDSA